MRGGMGGPGTMMVAAGPMMPGAMQAGPYGYALPVAATPGRPAFFPGGPVGYGMPMVRGGSPRP